MPERNRMHVPLLLPRRHSELQMLFDKTSAGIYLDSYHLLPSVNARILVTRYLHPGTLSFLLDVPDAGIFGFLIRPFLDVPGAGVLGFLIRPLPSRPDRWRVRSGSHPLLHTSHRSLIYVCLFGDSCLSG